MISEELATAEIHFHRTVEAAIIAVDRIIMDHLNNQLDIDAATMTVAKRLVEKSMIRLDHERMRRDILEVQRA